MKDSIQIALAGIFTAGMMQLAIAADEPRKAPEGTKEIKRTDGAKPSTSSRSNRAVIRNTRPNEKETSTGIQTKRGQPTSTSRNETGGEKPKQPVEHNLSEKERAYIAGLLELSKEQGEKLRELHQQLEKGLIYIKGHKELSNAEKSAKAKEAIERHENAVKNLLSAEQYKKLLVLRQKIGEKREGGAENGGSHKPGEANQGRPSSGGKGLGRQEGGSRPNEAGAKQPKEGGTPEGVPSRPEGRPEPLSGPKN